MFIEFYIIKNKILYILLLFFLLSVKGYAQTEVGPIENNQIDTLKINTFTVNLDLLFIISQKQRDKHADLTFMNGAQFNYRGNCSEVQLFVKQFVDRSTSGDLYTNHYVNLSLDFHRYPSSNLKKNLFRAFFPEPVFIFQNNTGRGLQKRFQTGLFIYPIRYLQPKLNFQLGIGCFYDWSSWEVNNMDKINSVSPDLQQKIQFINNHSKLRDNMYFDNSEFRPAIWTSFNCVVNDILNISCFAAYQQSVVSSFSKEIQTEYPELKKVYPYFYIHLAANVKVHKGFSFKTSFVLGDEKNMLSFYNSSWEYNLLFGVSWIFSKSLKK